MHCSGATKVLFLPCPSFFSIHSRDPPPQYSIGHKHTHCFGHSFLLPSHSPIPLRAALYPPCRCGYSALGWLTATRSRHTPALPPIRFFFHLTRQLSAPSRIAGCGPHLRAVHPRPVVPRCRGGERGRRLVWQDVQSHRQRGRRELRYALLQLPPASSICFDPGDAGTMFFVGHRSRRVVARGFRCNQHFGEFMFGRRQPGAHSVLLKPSSQYMFSMRSPTQHSF